jgi:hypothetical protein
MRGSRLVVGIIVGLALQAAPGGAQTARSGAWRLGAGAGVYHVDELAGTPMVPGLSVAREVGRRAVVGLDLAAISGAGRYGLDALAADLDVGVLVPRGRFELALTAGPSGLLGGDGDGTPYYSVGVHGAVGATLWATDRFGLTARVRVRQWITSPAEQSPGVVAGLVVRL